MRRSSGRGQAEPLPALVAVVAVGIGLSLYAGVLDASLPGSPDRHLAESAIERVESTIAPQSVARPSRIEAAQGAGPDGYRTNVTLTVGDRRWHAGPAAPGNADVASTRTSVQVAPATIRGGTLRVRVWK